MPKLINIEGVDGTGKHTISMELKENLEGLGFSVAMTDFPVYDSPAGKLVKDFLMGNVVGDPKNVKPFMGSMFYVMDRMAYFKDHIDSLAKYDFIISDRSYLSNLFFQASKVIKPISTSAISDDIVMNTNFDILYYFMNTMVRFEWYCNGLCDIVSPYDVRNIFLYHKDINTNDKLMKNRGRERDLNENLEYLQKINDFALSLYHATKNPKHIARNRYRELFALYPQYWYTPIECSYYKNNSNKNSTLYTPHELVLKIYTNIIAPLINYDYKDKDRQIIYTKLSDSMITHLNNNWRKFTPYQESGEGSNDEC